MRKGEGQERGMGKAEEGDMEIVDAVRQGKKRFFNVQLL